MPTRSVAALTIGGFLALVAPPAWAQAAESAGLRSLVTQLDLGPEELVQSAGDDLTVLGYSVPLFVDWNNDAPAFDAGTYVEVGLPGVKVELDVGLRATPSTVDWNNDGRKDLVVGAYDGYIRIYLNEGSDSAPDFRVERLAQSQGAPLLVSTLRSSPAVADLTGDGRKDLLVGDTEGRLLFFENTGTDAEPSFGGPIAVTSQQVPVDLPTARSRPSLGDWDDDGQLDVLVGSSDGRVRLYRTPPCRLRRPRGRVGGDVWP